MVNSRLEGINQFNLREFDRVDDEWWLQWWPINHSSSIIERIRDEHVSSFAFP